MVRGINVIPINSDMSPLATGSHSDSHHWKMERYVSASFLVLLPAAMLAPSNPIVDYGLAVVLPLHGHW